MYIHTTESSLETIKSYQELHGFESIDDAIHDMQECYDDLDNEDKSALGYYLRYRG